MRLEVTLEVVLSRLLTEHANGISTELAYRILDQEYRWPAEWRAPIPLGQAYHRLRDDGVDWKTLAGEELRRRYPTEPKWRNRLRFVVRHLRDRGWLDDAGKGMWRLSDAGRQAIQAYGTSALTDDERSIIDRSIGGEGREDSEDVESERQRVARSIFERQGQPQFRRNLILAYVGRCAITRCDALQALEAAHIVPVSRGGNDELSNGLLLRSDIHTLFDLNLLAIEPVDFAVRMADELRDTVYGALEGIEAVLLPEHRSARTALEQRWRLFVERVAP